MSKAVKSLFGVLFTFVLAASLLGCGSSNEGFVMPAPSTEPPPGTTTDAPTVMSTYPADNTAADVTAEISVTFNKPLDISSLANAVMVEYLSDTGLLLPVSGKISLSPTGTSIVFTPWSGQNRAELAGSAHHKVTVRASSIKDRSNPPKNMEKDYTFNFVTKPKSEKDTRKPMLTDSVFPKPGSSSVSLNTAVSMVFDEEMNEQSVASAVSIVETESSAAVSFQMSTTNKKAFNFAPAKDLSSGKTYRVSVSDVATDASGNSLDMSSGPTGQPSWTFTTETKYVASTSPGANETNVLVNLHTVKVTFLENMDVTSLKTDSLKIATSNGVQVSISNVTMTDLKTAVFTLGSRLLPGSVYQAEISSSVRNSSQVPMGNPYKWTFTAKNETDILPPTVSAQTPPKDSSNAGQYPNITATFSEAIDGFLIESKVHLFEVNPTTRTQTEVLAEISLDNVTGTVVTVKPLLQLSGALYSVRIEKTVMDLAGNQMISEVTWMFATGPQVTPDTTPPQILTRNPDKSATKVKVTSVVQVVFDEALLASSVNPGSLYPGGVALQGGIPGTCRLEADQRTVTFTPTAPLAYGTTYTVFVDGRVSDLAGNTTNSSSWTFTTEPTPDVTAPTITTTNPLYASVAIPTTIDDIALFFSEQMDVSTLNGTNIKLFLSGGGEVPVTVTAAADAKSVKIKPTSPLVNGGSYYLQIVREAIKDASDNKNPLDPNVPTIPITFDTQWTRLDGGNQEDEASAIATDSQGNVYIVLSSKSDVAAKYTSISDPNRDTTNATFDVHVLKYKVTGGVDYYGHLGTTKDDYAKAILVDGDGNVYVAGWTRGGDGDLTQTEPPAGMKTNTDKDMFVAKFVKFSDRPSATEMRPLWAKRYRVTGLLGSGDTKDEEVRAILMTPNRRMFVAGVVEETGDSPSKHSMLLEIDHSGVGARLWENVDIFNYIADQMPFNVKRYGMNDNVRFEGGLGGQEANALACDQSGNLYVAGSVLALHTYFYGQPGSFSMWDHDVVLAGYSTLSQPGTSLTTPNRKGLLFSEYVDQNTPAQDFAVGVHVDINGTVFVIGNTYGSMPTNRNAGLNDGFIAKYLPSGVGEPVWINQFGANGNDEPTATAINPAGNIYIVGRTNSVAIPGADVSNQGGHDGFVTMIDTYNGSRTWVKDIGTSGEEKALSVATDLFGNVYVGGYTSGDMFGLKNSGATDAFATKYNINGVRQ